MFDIVLNTPLGDHNEKKIFNKNITKEKNEFAQSKYK